MSIVADAEYTLAPYANRVFEVTFDAEYAIWSLYQQLAVNIWRVDKHTKTVAIHNITGAYYIVRKGDSLIASKKIARMAAI